MVTVLPHFDLYVSFSKKVRKILLDYTEFVEPFSIDESWLDVTQSKMFGSAEEIAEDIRRRVLEETGLTVSIGVSFNKIFAKLGSDMKKPNAITVITKDNFKQKVWPLPVSDMLMIGRATAKKLNDMGVFTIGELAKLDKNFLINKFGKNGIMLYEFSNGIGHDVVKNYNDFVAPKSIGNSTTCYKDLNTDEEVKEVFSTISTSVVARMINSGFTHAKTLKIWVKDNALQSFGKQCKFEGESTFENITATAYKLFCSLYDWHLPVRALGVSVCDFFDGSVQLDLFGGLNQKSRNLDNTILKIKNKFGSQSITTGNSLKDTNLSEPLGGLHSYQNSKNEK